MGLFAVSGSDAMVGKRTWGSGTQVKLFNHLNCDVHQTNHRIDKELLLHNSQIRRKHQIHLRLAAKATELYRDTACC